MDVGLKASLVRYPGGAVLERHSHDAGGVSIVLAGSIEEEVGSRTECGHVGSVVAKPAGTEHRNRVGREGAILLAIKGREADDIAAHGWRWAHSRLAAAVGLHFARHLKTGGYVDTEALFDLLACVNTATPDQAPTPAWIDEVRSRIDREPGSMPVTILAELADVHPVYLARVFRMRFGCSIREYRRKERVRRAANLLATCDLPIATVAAAVGFFDQSHLCRDFKAELNVSPSDYRAIIRS
jgi:AraC family transcriptional regulator